MSAEKGTFAVKVSGRSAAERCRVPCHAFAEPSLSVMQVGLAQMLKGGVIMDVTTAEEARIAEEAGAVAVMALERVPADIRRDGGVARMSDPTMIKAIKAAVTIPVMAKARIGHFVEAQILEALGVDYIDESEVGLSALSRGSLRPHRSPSASATPSLAEASALRPCRPQ
jgi:pyridoxal biosynthesis lyase PdxS